MEATGAQVFLQAKLRTTAVHTVDGHHSPTSQETALKCTKEVVTRSDNRKKKRKIKLKAVLPTGGFPVWLPGLDSSVGYASDNIDVNTKSSTREATQPTARKGISSDVSRCAFQNKSLDRA